jgi:hypothetical protein
VAEVEALMWFLWWADLSETPDFETDDFLDPYEEDECC